MGRRATAAALLAGTGLLLVACGAPGDPVVEPADGAWVPTRWTDVVAGRDEACQELADRLGPGDDAVDAESEPPPAVERDLGAVQDLLVDGSERVLGVGLTTCQDRWVISAYVTTSLTTVPAEGPDGTPVMAYREKGVRQICTMQVGNGCDAASSRQP